MKKDDKGRITGLEGDYCHSGHSVCNSCGKDMPGCWDVVCYSCNKTFCYKCSIIISGYWYCKNECHPGIKKSSRLLTRFEILKQK
jgi:hypothetical protein